jgi:hypothetical protein
MTKSKRNDGIISLKIRTGEAREIVIRSRSERSSMGKGTGLLLLLGMLYLLGFGSYWTGRRGRVL